MEYFRNKNRCRELSTQRQQVNIVKIIIDKRKNKNINN